MNIIDETGSYWYLDGTLIYHREDGPAVEWHDGTKSWWQNGRRHREDGPAITYSDEFDGLYYLNGMNYSFEEWIKEIPVSAEEKILLYLKWKN